MGMPSGAPEPPLPYPRAGGGGQGTPRHASRNPLRRLASSLLDAAGPSQPAQPAAPAVGALATSYDWAELVQVGRQALPLQAFELCSKQQALTCTT